MQNPNAYTTRKKLILAGNTVELFEYEYPIGRNLSSLRLSGGKVSGASSGKERRVDNLGYVRSQIRHLVECNHAAFGFEPVFLTFTFRENLTDLKSANALFHDFLRRFSRKVGKPLRYLVVVEFQARGAVHYHCIFFNLDLEWERRERRTRTVARLWGHGFVDIERIRSAKRVGPYVCKYLNKGLLDPRLRGKKAYFTSRKLLRPIVFWNEETIDRVLSRYNLETVRVDTYQSYKGNCKKTEYVNRNDSGL